MRWAGHVAGNGTMRIQKFGRKTWRKETTKQT